MSSPDDEADDRLARRLADTDSSASPDTPADLGRLARAQRLVACLAAARPPRPPGADEVLDLIAREIHLRREVSRPIDLDEYISRFPELADRIRQLAAPSPLPGLPLRYRVGQLLGQGGMGQVYSAHDTALDRPIAVKVLSRPGPLLAELMHRESILLAALRHPHIVAVYDSGELADGRPYFVMEFVAGSTFDRHLATSHPDVRGVAALVGDVAAAVGIAHALGIVHRDLKPQNIKVTPAGEVRVLDFGLAKRIDADLPAVAPSGDPGAATGVLGTRAYMSPEQSRGEKVDARTDVFALGTILDQVLPARRPRDLRAVVARCTAPDRAARYPNAAALADDLRRFVAGEPVTARRTPAWERVVKWARRRPVMATLAAGATAAVVALLVVWLTFTAEVRAKQKEAEHNAGVADRERLEAERQKQNALTSLRQAQAAAREFYLLVRDDNDLKKQGLEPLRFRVLRQTTALQERLAEDHGPDPDLRGERVQGYHLLAQLAHEIGTPEEAIGFVGRAIEIAAGLVRDHPERFEYASFLATVLSDRATYLRSRNRFDEAEPDYRRAIDVLAPWPARLPAADSQRVLWHLARVRTRLGQVLVQRDRLGDAEASYLTARGEIELSIRLFREATGKGPLPDYSDTEAGIGDSLGVLYMKARRMPQAAEEYRRAISIREQLVRRMPGYPAYERALATGHANLAEWYHLSSRTQDAVDEITKGIEVQTRLATAHPKVRQYQIDLGNRFWLRLGDWERNRGRRGEAAAAYRQAADIFTRLQAEVPEEWAHAADLGTALARLASMVGAAERGKVIDRLTRALNAADAWAGRPESAAKAKTLRGNLYAVRARMLDRAGQYGDALADWDKALEPRDLRQRPQIRLGRAGTLARLGDHTRAAQEADDLSKAGTWSAVELLELAGVYAVAHAAAMRDTRLSDTDRARVTADYVGRARQSLDRARQAGALSDPARRDQFLSAPEWKALLSLPEFKDDRDPGR